MTRSVRVVIRRVCERGERGVCGGVGLRFEGMVGWVGCVDFGY